MRVTAFDSCSCCCVRLTSFDSNSKLKTYKQIKCIDVFQVVLCLRSFRSKYNHQQSITCWFFVLFLHFELNKQNKKLIKRGRENKNKNDNKNKQRNRIKGIILNNRAEIKGWHCHTYLNLNKSTKWEQRDNNLTKEQKTKNKQTNNNNKQQCHPYLNLNKSIKIWIKRQQLSNGGEIKWTINMALVAAHLNAGVILVVTV